jgi:hypothetical protein
MSAMLASTTENDAADFGAGRVVWALAGKAAARAQRARRNGKGILAGGGKLVDGKLNRVGLGVHLELAVL